MSEGGPLSPFSLASVCLNYVLYELKHLHLLEVAVNRVFLHQETQGRFTHRNNIWLQNTGALQ